MKWEYLVEGLPTQQSSNIGIVKPMTHQDLVSAHLNLRGYDGWELVQFGQEEISGGCDIYAPGVVFVFKRPK